MDKAVFGEVGEVGLGKEDIEIAGLGDVDIRKPERRESAVLWEDFDIVGAEGQAAFKVGGGLGRIRKSVDLPKEGLALDAVSIREAKTRRDSERAVGAADGTREVVGFPHPDLSGRLVELAVCAGERLGVDPEKLLPDDAFLVLQSDGGGGDELEVKELLRRTLGGLAVTKVAAFAFETVEVCITKADPPLFGDRVRTVGRQKARRQQTKAHDPRRKGQKTRKDGKKILHVHRIFRSIYDFQIPTPAIPHRPLLETELRGGLGKLADRRSIRDKQIKDNDAFGLKSGVVVKNLARKIDGTLGFWSRKRCDRSDVATQGGLRSALKIQKPVHVQGISEVEI